MSHDPTWALHPQSTFGSKQRAGDAFQGGLFLLEMRKEAHKHYENQGQLERRHPGTEATDKTTQMQIKSKQWLEERDLKVRAHASSIPTSRCVDDKKTAASASVLLRPPLAAGRRVPARHRSARALRRPPPCQRLAWRPASGGSDRRPAMVTVPPPRRKGGLRGKGHARRLAPQHLDMHPPAHLHLRGVQRAAVMTLGARARRRRQLLKAHLHPRPRQQRPGAAPGSNFWQACLE